MEVRVARLALYSAPQSGSESPLSVPSAIPAMPPPIPPTLTAIRSCLFELGEGVSDGSPWHIRAWR